LNSLYFNWLHHQSNDQVIATEVDCFQLFTVIKQQVDNCYLFESSSHIARLQDRYITLGFDPLFTIAVKGKILTFKGDATILSQLFNTEITTDCVQIEQENPYQFIQRNCQFNYDGVTQQGGLIGYFCYEAVNHFQTKVQLKEHPNFDCFSLGFYDDGLTYDITTGVLQYYSFYRDRSSRVQQWLHTMATTTIKKPFLIKALGNNTTKQQFKTAVAATIDRIKNGYIYQAEVGMKSKYLIKGDKLAIYAKLREVNPSPYMYYIKDGNKELIGASPEVLVSCKQRYVFTTPTAGTAPRDNNDPIRDRQLAAALLSDEKELAEHRMLVDLHRNDLSRVCVAGSVRISDLMYIAKFPFVQHIVTDICGSLSPSSDAFDVLASLLPGGVVAGAPKLESIKVIDDNETEPRGPYGGAVGRFALNGDCDFCLPIRSLFCSGDDCFVQTSAGIVADSNPDKEYREVQNKLMGMQTTLDSLIEP